MNQTSSMILYSYFFSGMQNFYICPRMQWYRRLAIENFCSELKFAAGLIDSKSLMIQIFYVETLFSSLYKYKMLKVTCMPNAAGCC